MGAEIKSDSKYIYLKADKLKPIEFEFPKISVTGTENLMMAAVFTRVKQHLKIVQKNQRWSSLQIFLIMWCFNSWAGESTIEITGVDSLGSVEWDVLFDRIEAGTYLLQELLQMATLQSKRLSQKQYKF